MNERIDCHGLSLAATLLLHQLEGAFLGLVSSLDQILKGLLSESMLLAAYNAALVLHEILLREATGCVLSTAMPDLGLAANSGHLGGAASGTATTASRHVLALRGVSFGTGVHFCLLV